MTRARRRAACALALALATVPSCGPAVRYERRPSTDESERRLVSNPALPAARRSPTEHFEWDDSLVVTSSPDERVRDCPTFDLRRGAAGPSACALEASRCGYYEGDVTVGCVCRTEPADGRQWRCHELIRP